MGVGDPLSLFARYWISQTHRGTSLIHTLSSLKMTTRPQLYKVCSSYCFGAKHCFWLRACDISKTESAWNRLFLCSLVMNRHGQPVSAYQDKQHPLGKKQFFFLAPLLLLQRAISETSGFWLLLPISCPFHDRVWHNHMVWCKGLMSGKRKQTSLQTWTCLRYPCWQDIFLQNPFGFSTNALDVP